MKRAKTTNFCKNRFSEEWFSGCTRLDSHDENAIKGVYEWFDDFCICFWTKCDACFEIEIFDFIEDRLKRAFDLGMDDGADGLGDEGFPVLDDGEGILNHEVEFEGGEGWGERASRAIGDYALGNRRVTSLGKLDNGCWIAETGGAEHGSIENVDVCGHAGVPEAGEEEAFLKIFGGGGENAGENLRRIGHNFYQSLRGR